MRPGAEAGSPPPAVRGRGRRRPPRRARPRPRGRRPRRAAGGTTGASPRAALAAQDPLAPSPGLASRSSQFEEVRRSSMLGRGPSPPVPSRFAGSLIAHHPSQHPVPSGRAPAGGRARSRRSCRTQGDLGYGARASIARTPPPASDPRIRRSHRDPPTERRSAAGGWIGRGIGRIWRTCSDPSTPSSSRASSSRSPSRSTSCSQPSPSGLASYLAVLNGLWLWTKQHRYLELFRYWVKIFALAFAMGVVSGIVMSYQFGTNWSVFSDRTGPVLGAPMAYEVLSAFFLEAGFLGIMLFGREKVGPQASHGRLRHGGVRDLLLGLLDPERQLLDAHAAGLLDRRRDRAVPARELLRDRVQPVPSPTASPTP